MVSSLQKYFVFYDTLYFCDKTKLTQCQILPQWQSHTHHCTNIIQFLLHNIIFFTRPSSPSIKNCPSGKVILLIVCRSWLPNFSKIHHVQQLGIYFTLLLWLFPKRRILKEHKMHDFFLQYYNHFWLTFMTGASVRYSNQSPSVVFSGQETFTCNMDIRVTQAPNSIICRDLQ